MDSYLFSICSAVYATLAALIAIQARQRTNIFLAVCCCWTSIWALSEAFAQQPLLSGASGLLDLGRIIIWYTYLLSLYQRSGVASKTQIFCFGFVTILALVSGAVTVYTFDGAFSYTLLSVPVAVRLAVCICELLLIENLYLNLPEHARWHIALPCILLGFLACFDLLVNADAVLFSRPSPQLLSARIVALVIVAPFLVLTALRNQRWHKPIRLSRSAVFHSATLVLSGSVLLALALVGELLRHMDDTWGWVAELSLLFSGLIGILTCLSSRSAKSIIDRVLVHHLFADRYDYRVQWLNCIATLSGKKAGEESDLHTRAIRAVADALDSPSGILFIQDDVLGSVTWASSWNMPSRVDLPLIRSLAQKMSKDVQVLDFGVSVDAPIQAQLAQELGPVWLAIPLLHGSGLIGLVIVGPPRVLFQVDQEVFDLLAILGQEIGTYLSEQHAASAVNETRDLHEYGKRFAFVAHDIKNVSSQLALLLSNAEHYLDDPEFQRDMLATVHSSVEKIDRLLKRLDNRRADTTVAVINPAERINSLPAIVQRRSNIVVTVIHTGPTGKIAISPHSFDMIITHLVDNAVEASPCDAVTVAIEQDASNIVIGIIDKGGGMSAEFIRDELFSPFKTRKVGGSGIGAFQARELIREATGELHVVSEPGQGTIMRIVFMRADRQQSPISNEHKLKAVGD